MKRLVLLRHAKAEAYAADGSDFARELTGRGRRDAMATGVQLAGLGLDKALVSSSARTRQTFLGLGLDLDVEHLDELYNCGSVTMLALIAETPEHVSGLLVVGHSPAIPALAAELSRDAESGGVAWSHGWPTSAFACFEFDAPWSAFAQSSGPRLRTQGVRRPG